MSRQKPGGRKGKPRKAETNTAQKPARRDRNGEQLRRQQLEAKAFELRLAGNGYREIAHQCGCAVSTAHDMVKRVYQRGERELAETAAHVCMVQVLRIERLIEANWPQAIGKPARRDETTGELLPAEPPDLKAGKLIVGTYIARLAKLLGLEQREPLIVSGGEDPLKLSMADLPDEDLQQIAGIFERLAQSKAPDTDGPARIPASKLTTRLTAPNT